MKIAMKRSGVGISQPRVPVAKTMNKHNQMKRMRKTTLKFADEFIRPPDMIFRYEI
jgi:hypothetical protein